VGEHALTFYFPTVDTAPKAKSDGNAAVVGRQRVTFNDGNLVLQVTGQ
jgi:hypothetical protein